MTDSKKKLPVPGDLDRLAPEKVKGLTMSELRYQRALLALEKEFCKEKMNISLMRVRNYSPFKSSGSSSTLGSMGKVASVAGKLFSKASYLEYAMVGFSIFSTVKKFYSRIKKKK